MVRHPGDTKVAPQEKVVDASVVVKWFSDEEGSDRALKLRDGHIGGELSLVAPELILYEVTNALRYKPLFDSSKVSRAFHDLLEFQLELVQLTEDLLKTCVDFAFRHGTTLYDSVYLGLGKSMDIDVVTADKKFYSKCSKLKGISLL